MSLMCVLVVERKQPMILHAVMVLVVMGGEGITYLQREGERMEGGRG